MLFALIQSNISSYPHRNVTLQFFETTARYPDFFKVRQECIMPTLEAMIDARQVYVDGTLIFVLNAPIIFSVVCTTRTQAIAHE
jgi:hypothetical protein